MHPKESEELYTFMTAIEDIRASAKGKMKSDYPEEYKIVEDFIKSKAYKGGGEEPNYTEIEINSAAFQNVKEYFKKINPDTDLSDEEITTLLSELIDDTVTQAGGDGYYASVIDDSAWDSALSVAKWNTSKILSGLE
jgi:hypothetical protein